MPSSLINTLARQLEVIPEPVKSSLTPGTMRKSLVLSRILGSAGGIRYGLTGILILAVCAIACRGEVVCRDR